MKLPLTMVQNIEAQNMVLLLECSGSLSPFEPQSPHLENDCVCAQTHMHTKNNLHASSDGLLKENMNYTHFGIPSSQFYSEVNLHELTWRDNCKLLLRVKIKSIYK
jgi:hypothetical protein